MLTPVGEGGGGGDGGTRLKGPGSTRFTLGSVSGRVEGGQCDEVGCVTGQVGEGDPGVGDKDHRDLLRLVLPVSLPVVNLRHRKWFLSTTSAQVTTDFISSSPISG